MKINADFDKRVVVHSDNLDWLDSPMKGVSRRLLDRIGAETARATSIVRYQPDSYFSPHVHTGGEEFIVLSGVFQDEHGDFPTGSYIRNPPQSKHTPGSKDGCVIFVKLWQFQAEDRLHVRLNMNAMTPVPNRSIPGVSTIPLYSDHFENVSVHHFEANAHMHISASGGAEVLVLEGTLREAQDTLVQNSWVRIPIGGTLTLNAGANGAKIWIKTGHLTQLEEEIVRLPLV